MAGILPKCWFVAHVRDAFIFIVSAFPTALSWWCIMLLKQLSPSHSINMVGQTTYRDLVEIHPIPLPSLHGGTGSSLPGLVIP